MMAYYKRSKLPPLKLIHHPSKRVVDVHRGVVSCSDDTGSNSLSNSDRLALAQPLRLASCRCNHGEVAAHIHTLTRVLMLNLHTYREAAEGDELSQLGFGDHDFMIGADIDMIEPSLHEIQSKASISAWQQLQEEMLTITTENSAMPVGQKCLSCDDQAFFRCVKCGPFSFYCFECFCRQHRTSNFFHVAEKWEVRQ